MTSNRRLNFIDKVSFRFFRTDLYEPENEGLFVTYSKLADSAEYAHLADYREAFDTAMVQMVPSLTSQLRNATVAFQDAYKTLRGFNGFPQPDSVRFAWFLILTSSTFCALAIYAYSTLGFSDTYLVYPVFAPPFFFTSVIVFVIGSWRLSGYKPNIERQTMAAVADIQVRKEELQQQQASLVREAFTQIVNKVAGPDSDFPFPTKAPRLVELNTSEVVPSTSALYVRDFIRGHESSAVGIAGPRGSGKSTLMRWLADKSDLDTRDISMTAPVRYDALDFTRRLFLNAAETIDRHNDSASHRFSAQRERRIYGIRTGTGLVAFTLGMLLILFDLFPVSPFVEFRLDTVGPVGAALVLYGVVVALNAVASSRDSKRRVRTARPSRLWKGRKDTQIVESSSSELAIRAISRLTQDSESNSKHKSVSKLFGGLLGLEDEESVTLKDRALSHADLVNDLRRLLAAFARDEHPHPVVILIDELDKITLTTDLIETVNDLKDLFHIEGVHFIVSVSTDALHSFEQRGLTSRDAFDSSFDTIIQVMPLTLNESLRILSSRAFGFPPVVGAFCHAWSGGLPRDLLRFARRCVEIQRAATTTLPVDSLICSVITEDLMAIVEGRLRSPGAPKDVRARLDALRRRVQELEKVPLSRLSDLRSMPHPGPAAGPEKLLDVGVSDDEPTEEELVLSSVTSVMLLGEAIVGYFTALDPPARWIIPDESMFQTAAEAMSLRGDVDEMRAEAFEIAVGRFREGYSG